MAVDYDKLVIFYLGKEFDPSANAVEELATKTAETGLPLSVLREVSVTPRKSDIADA
jgi:hypothetical protein